MGTFYFSSPHSFQDSQIKAYLVRYLTIWPVTDKKKYVIFKFGQKWLEISLSDYGGNTEELQSDVENSEM